jgi:hypothetical protein
MESTDLLDIDQEDFPGMHEEMCLKTVRGTKLN